MKKTIIKTVNPDKLLKLSTYAKREGRTRGRIYQIAKGGSLKIVEIDGVKFVQID